MDTRQYSSMDNHHAYTPLDSPYPMGWPPRGCNWCGDDEMVWAYPLGEVTFWRQVSPDEEPKEVRHTAQPWFACARCKSFLDECRWDELADEVGRPRGYWSRLQSARLPSRGYPWRGAGRSR